MQRLLSFLASRPQRAAIAAHGASAHALTARGMLLSEAELRALSHQDLLRYAISLTRGDPTFPSATCSENKQKSLTTRRAASDTVEAPPAKKRKARQFDASRYGVRPIALHIAYAGWAHHGFASQPLENNTVEAHLFSALQLTHLITNRASCNYSRAGRTDVRVSAYTQIVSLVVRSNLIPPLQTSAPPKTISAAREIPYVKVLNAVLPKTIRALAWTPVSATKVTSGPLVHSSDTLPVKNAAKSVIQAASKPGALEAVRRPDMQFSARFDATYRAYKYFFIRGALNLTAMKEAANMFVGEHNFRNFCKVDTAISNFVRIMYEVDVRVEEKCDANHEFDMCCVYVKGQAFLWHQVRCMAAVLFLVGSGKETPQVVKMMLDDAQNGLGKPQYRMAAPEPLVLCECEYPQAVVAFPQQPGANDSLLSRADGDLALIYAEHALKAAVIKEMLKKNDDIKVTKEDAQECTHEDDIGFGTVRNPRFFLLDAPRGAKYIPLRKRMREGKREEHTQINNSASEDGTE